MKKINVQEENYSANFSEFYDAYLTSHADRATQKIKNIIDEYGLKDKNDKQIVDFMCGTGTLLKEFEDSWKTIGIDISSSMLNVARKNLSKTELVQADVTSYFSKEEADVIVSTADAINHLPNLKLIDKMFFNVQKSLKYGGIFIFDMNTNLGINRNAMYISSSDENGLCIREGFVDNYNNVGYTRFQGFFKTKKEDNYKRFDTIIYNYIYNINTIQELLNKNKLHVERVLDFDTGKSWDEKNTERVLIVAKNVGRNIKYR